MFTEETGLNFSFIFALYAGLSGEPATENDSADYAALIDNPPFPVLADGERRSVSATPLTLDSYPEMCALAPDLTILGCYTGHGKHEDAFVDIEAHAGL